MKEKADAWQMDIATLSWEFEQLLIDLNEEQINRKANADSWSIAEVLDHLIQMHMTYFSVFEEIIQKKYKAPWVGKIAFLVNATGNFLVKAMKNPRKIKTFPVWEPKKSDYPVTVVNDFFNQQHQLSSYVQKLEPYFDQKIVIRSPANRWVMYYLDQAIIILIFHEKRHLDQIHSLMDQIKQK